MSGLADIAKIARERRHTLLFLARLRRVPPVFLDTEIDMTRVLEHRETGRRYSIVTYVLYAAGRALAKHPEANAAIEGGLSPKVARYAPVNGKLTLDRTLNGHRVVLSGLVKDLDRIDLDAVQDRVEALRDGDPHTLPDFAGARLLHRLPAAVGWAAYELAARALDKRPDTTGTFSVTSLGHRPVDGFHSLGGTTVTLGVGRILDRPVVRDGAVAVAPVMRLNLSFDHRVIDGAEAADLLADVKDGLENF
ncbi:2-oxo acid dehydrogenase subunit E2 [Actinomadura rayongensis]|uniref:2-oxo acid dehydrogenase subunit E2 n=1 Tax=Actinomadura rayongensis TaxID=1429076 RepID=UPI0019262696